MDVNSLRIVILDWPIQTWESKQTRDLFCKIVELKLRGYGKEFAEHVLPLDTTDFYGTHLTLCTEDSGELHPVVAYKSVPLSRCDKYGHTFPALNAIRLSQVTQYEPQLTRTLAESRNNAKDVSYDSSWTMSPEIRTDKVLSKQIRDLISTIGVRYHQDYSVPQWITCGVHKFKTNQYFKWMGLSEITFPFPLYTSDNETVTMYQLKKYSAEVLDIANRNKYFWDNRLIICKTEETTPQKIAA